MTFVRIASACAISGFAAATLAAPIASAAPQDCSPGAVAGTVAQSSSSARAYLDTHPGANQAVATAQNQPRDEASVTLRTYFSTNPGEYNDFARDPRADRQRAGSVQRAGAAAQPGVGILRVHGGLTHRPIRPNGSQVIVGVVSFRQ